MNLPLTGVKVLSAARYLPAGYGTMLLAYAGADVIMVEQPRGGIDERITNPTVFNAVNRDKRSLAINLRSDKGREICYELVRQSDVFIEGFRPGVVTRLGVDYETLKSVNPKIVYVSISGFGQDGPYRLKAGHDLTYQGIAGMLAGLYSEKEHSFSPSLTGLGDLGSAMLVAISTLSALYGVKQNGQGQYIDISMTDGIFSWMSSWLNENDQFNALIQNVGYNIYQTRDNKFITLSIVGEDHFWRNLCNVVHKEELAGLSHQERKDRSDELSAIFKDIFLSKTRDEWVQILADADIPSGPAYTLAEEVFNDPQLRHRNMIIEEDDPDKGRTVRIGSPLKFQGDSKEAKGHIPALGEHNEEILRSLGYNEEGIKQLKEEGVI